MTQPIAINQPAQINADRLNEEMKIALGNKYESMDTGVLLTKGAPKEDAKIIVRLTDDATSADKDKAASVIDAHKPEILSKSQQKTKDRADAFTRFKDFDFTALDKMKINEQMPVVIGLLKDIQKLMQGTE